MRVGNPIVAHSQGKTSEFYRFGAFGTAELAGGDCLEGSGFEEHAYNGLASARPEGRVPRPLVPCLRGLCACR